MAVIIIINAIGATGICFWTFTGLSEDTPPQAAVAPAGSSFFVSKAALCVTNPWSVGRGSSPSPPVRVVKKQLCSCQTASCSAKPLPGNDERDSRAYRSKGRLEHQLCRISSCAPPPLSAAFYSRTFPKPARALRARIATRGRRGSKGEI